MILILPGYFSGAQSSLQNLLFKTHSQRLELLTDFYPQLAGGDSIAVFRKIDSIRQLAVTHGDKDLQMEVSLLCAGYYYFRTYLGTHRILSVIDSVREEAVGRKKRWAEASALNMAALVNFRTVRNYELGFELHQRVYNIIKDMSPADYPQKQGCLFQMAEEYYFFRDFEESIRFNKLALEAEPVLRPHSPSLRTTILNMLGLAYQKLNGLDSSDYYLKEAYAKAARENDTPWMGITSGNLGYNAFLRKDFATAIPLLEKDVAIAVQYSDWALASGSMMVLGDISLQQKNIRKARQQLSAARINVYRSGQYQRLQVLYPLLARLYSAEGNTTMAAVFLDSALFVKDSLARELNALQMLRAKQKVDQEKYKVEVEGVRSQQKINIIERNFLIAVVLLLMAVAVIIYKTQQRKQELQREKIKKAGEELDAATRQLNDFAKHISEKNALLEMWQEQHGSEVSEAFRQLQESTILTDEDWEYFRKLFEKVHSGFLQRLKEKLPGLTPAETRFMVLSKLGLSIKEMAAMLGIGTDGIRKLRGRVRKKLNLGEETPIEDFISRI